MCWARGRRGYFAYWGSEPILKYAGRGRRSQDVLKMRVGKLGGRLLLMNLFIHCSVRTGSSFPQLPPGTSATRSHKADTSIHVTSVHNTLFSLQPTNSRIVLELLEIVARVYVRQKSQHGGHQRRRNLAHRRPTSTFQCHEARAGQKAQEISLTFLLNPETRRFSFRFKKKIDLTFHIFKTPKIILPSTSKAETSRPASPNHGCRAGEYSTEANTT
jgi:hypothetical protein